MRLRTLLSIVAILFALGSAGRAQTPAFTYQGRLTDMSAPASGIYDFQFALFDEGGTQVTPFLNRPNVTVNNGIFTVELSFGTTSFPGANRFLQTAVKKPADTEFTILSPRQQITSSPYALKSVNSAQLGGVDAAQFVQTNDGRLSDDRNPTAGSGFYVQNSTSQQPVSNFNVSGTGAADKFNAATHYEINGNRVLSVGGSSNTFVGVGAASVNSGTSNSFFGFEAGRDNTDGDDNAFFGRMAGRLNTTGSFNSFFGVLAGRGNTTGTRNTYFGYTAGSNSDATTDNSYFGYEAGRSTNAGINNAFFGSQAGTANTGGGSNSFFGFNAGLINEGGNSNSFFGARSGNANTSGESNTFIGSFSGQGNTVGSNNTLLGRFANVGANNLTFATAIGAQAIVSTSNTIVLGRSNGSDKVRVPGLGAAGFTPLCRNTDNEISTCAAGVGAANADRQTIDELQRVLARQQLLIEALLKIACAQNSDADLCAPKDRNEK